MKAALQIVLAAALCFSLAGQTTSSSSIVFEDDFAEGLNESWRWLRENPKHWRHRDGTLEIRLDPGVADTVRNALVRTAPDRAKQAYAIEVTLRTLTPPTEQYEQAGITWYVDGKPVFKLVKELIDGRLCIIPGRVAMDAETVQLRLIVTADSYIAQFRPAGEAEYQTAQQGALPPPAKDEVSLQGYHGPADADHWVRFDDFRIVKVDSTSVATQPATPRAASQPARPGARAQPTTRPSGK